MILKCCRLKLSSFHACTIRYAGKRCQQCKQFTTSCLYLENGYRLAATYFTRDVMSAWTQDAEHSKVYISQNLTFPNAYLCNERCTAKSSRGHTEQNHTLQTPHKRGIESRKAPGRPVPLLYSVKTTYCLM